MRSLSSVSTGCVPALSLAARRSQLNLITRTRRQSQGQGAVQLPVKAKQQGTVTQIKLDVIASAIAATQAEVEVVLAATIGDYMAFHDLFATVSAPTQTAAAVRAVQDERRQTIGILHARSTRAEDRDTQ